jgi:peptidyl-prolyl cis-trans isomerase D
MLNVMRSNLKHLKWILVIVAFSMVLYLGYYFDFSNFGGAAQGGADKDWAAYVGDSVISTLELERRLGRVEEAYRQQLQDQFDSVRKQLRLPEVALNDLVNKTLMLQEARRLGLSVDEQEVTRVILSLPAFRTPEGFVGKERYAQILAANNLSVQGFEADLAEELLIDKWRQLVTAPIVVTEQEIESTYKMQAETVSFEYVSIPPNKWTAPQPSDAEGRAYFERNAGRFRRADGRTASFVLVETPPAATVLSTDEVRRYYQENQPRFERPEQRRARHILIKADTAGGAEADTAARSRAEDLANRLKAGGDFLALARKFSEDPGSAKDGGDLGWFGRGAMVPEFEQAAFSAKPGDIVGPVKSAFGYHIIQVTEDRPAGVTPFEEVSQAIAEQLAEPRQRQAVSTRAQQLVGALKDPAKFEEAARAQGFIVRDAGVILPGSEVPGLGPQPSISQAVLGTQVGQIAGPVMIPQGAVVLKVTGDFPASRIGYEQVRPSVLSELHREKARETALSQSRGELAKAGGTLSGAASRLGLSVQSAGPVRRGEPIAGLPADRSVESALFEARPGDAPLVLAAGDGSVLLARVTARGQPNPAELASLRDQIRGQIEERKSSPVMGAFIRQLRQSANIKINQELFDRLNS